MLVNSIRNLIYSDGVVSFDLVFQDPRKKSVTLDVTRIDMPFEKLVAVNGILGVELEKIGKVHKQWMQKQLDAAPAAQEKPPVEPAKAEAPAKKPERPRAGRLIKKV